MIGRIIVVERTQERNYVQYVLPWDDFKTDFTQKLAERTAEIVVGDSQGTMIRATDQFRGEMPEAMCIFYDLCTALEEPVDTTHHAGNDEVCSLCEQATDTTATTCPVCLLTLHAACADLLLAKYHSYADNTVDDDADGEVLKFLRCFASCTADEPLDNLVTTMCEHLKPHLDHLCNVCSELLFEMRTEEDGDMNSEAETL